MSPPHWKESTRATKDLYPIVLWSTPRESPGDTERACYARKKTQTQLQHKAVSRNTVKKQLKKTSPAKPKTRGKGLLLARKCRSCAKKYIPVCRSYHPASYTHITWEPWSGTHFRNIPPKLESLISFKAKEPQAVLLTQIYLRQKCREKAKKEYCLFSGKADGRKSHKWIQNSSILPLFSTAGNSCCQS